MEFLPDSFGSPSDGRPVQQGAQCDLSGSHLEPCKSLLHIDLLNKWTALFWLNRWWSNATQRVVIIKANFVAFQLSNTIRLLQPKLDFSLTLKNITRVWGTSTITEQECCDSDICFYILVRRSHAQYLTKETADSVTIVYISLNMFSCSCCLHYLENNEPD